MTKSMTGSFYLTETVTMAALQPNSTRTQSTVDLSAYGQSLVASASISIDAANNLSTAASDFYPDNFGPASLSEAFLVVNDTLYLTTGNDGFAVGTAALFVTARIRCRVVKLSTKDWMAIAIQSTAEA